MQQAHKPTPLQKKRALVSGVVLALMVLAIYSVFAFQMFASR